MKTRKLLLLVLLVVLGIANMFAAGQARKTPLAKQSANETTTWEIKGDTLIIGGFGQMANYSSADETPWYDKRQEIHAVVIQENVISVGSYAFSECEIWKEVVLPSTLVAIEAHAFEYCRSLTKITLPSGLLAIGDMAFGYCWMIQAIVCEGTTPPECYSNVFTSFGSTVYVPKESLDAYRNADGWKQFNKFVTCDNGVYAGTCGEDLTWELNTKDSTFVVAGSGTMDNYDYYSRPWWLYCTYIKTVSLPEGLITIGANAFNGCEALTEIKIPESVVVIQPYAFTSSGLKTVFLPKNVNTVDYAFRDCQLESFTVADDNATFSTIDGVLFSKDKTKLIVYPAGKEGTSYAIPDGVVTIGECVFAYLGTLKSITIPGSVTTIKGGAFDWCTGLEELSCKAVTPPSIESSTFFGVNKEIPLFVPAGSKLAYQAAYYWKEFVNIKEIELPATEADVASLQAVAGAHDATISWPAVDGAEHYILTITQGAKTLYAMHFDKDGQLLGVAYSPARRSAQSVQDAKGWKYTVGSLEPSTTYECTVEALQGEVSLYRETKSFLTQLEDGIYVLGAATGFTDMQTEGVGKCKMADGINEWTYQKREGMYEKHIVLDADKNFTIVKKEGNTYTYYTADLSSQQIQTSEYPVTGYVGDLSQSTIAMKVPEQGLYHIIVDFNLIGDITAQRIWVVPVSWTIRGDMNYWGNTEGELDAETMTWTWKDVKFTADSHFGFDYSKGWKLNLNDAQTVTAFTYFSFASGTNELVYIGSSTALTLAEAGAYTISISFQLAAGEVTKSYSYSVERTGDVTYSNCEMELCGDAVAEQEGAYADPIWHWGNVFPLGKPTRNGDLYTWERFRVKFNTGFYVVRTKNFEESGNMEMYSESCPEITADGEYDVKLVYNALTGTFTYSCTPSGEHTAMDEISDVKDRLSTKFIRNGQLFIIRNGRMFNALGTEVE